MLKNRACRDFAYDWLNFRAWPKRLSAPRAYEMLSAIAGASSTTSIFMAGGLEHEIAQWLKERGAVDARWVIRDTGAEPRRGTRCLGGPSSRALQQGSDRRNKSCEINGVPKGSRTPVAGMKTRCPRPLDDGDTRPRHGCCEGTAPRTSVEPMVSAVRLELTTNGLKGRCSTN